MREKERTFSKKRWWNIKVYFMQRNEGREYTQITKFDVWSILE